MLCRIACCGPDPSACTGKVYTLTTGASQPRWAKMAERLKTVSDSFTLLGY